MSWAVRQVWFSSLKYLGPKTISNIRVQKEHQKDGREDRPQSLTATNGLRDSG